MGVESGNQGANWRWRESGVTVRIERIEGSRGSEQEVVTTASTDVEGSRVMRNRNDAPPEQGPRPSRQADRLCSKQTSGYKPQMSGQRTKGRGQNRWFSR